MAYPPEHVRTTFSGTLGTTAPYVEAWSFNLNFSPGAIATADGQVAITTLTTVAGAMRDAWSTHLAPVLQTAVRLTRVRCANVQGSQQYPTQLGKVRTTAEGQYVQGDNTTVAAGTQTYAGTPFQTAYACSLVTPRAGAVGRGRFYVPLPGGAVNGATGQMADAQHATLTAALDAFVTACDAAAASGWSGSLVVASGGSVKYGIPAALHNVTGIRVGKVPDTIRRRRRSLVEAHVPAAI